MAIVGLVDWQLLFLLLLSNFRGVVEIDLISDTAQSDFAYPFEVD